MTEEVRERLTLLTAESKKEDKGDEHEQGGGCNCYKEREPSLLLENEAPEMTKTPNSGSIFKYIYQELTWGQRSLPKNDDIYKERCEKVYTFIRAPGKIESFMFYGLLCCLDIFISLFTLLPLRCIVNAIKTVLWPIRRFLLGPRQFFFQSQVIDFVKVTLVLLTAMAPWSPLVFSNTSVIYHTIRGQELIKLYIIYNMLEVADRLIASVGQDTMDSFFWCLTHPRPMRLILHTIFAILYMFVHSFIMLLQATTLNVAFNNHNKVLLLIMMSNNFIEIKGSVFKKFEKNNLFQVTCADVRERFHLFWLLYIVLIRNLSQRDWSVEAIEDILPYMALILGTEFIIDWMKHSFIIKFNNLSVDIYPEYKLIIAQEFIRARNPANCIEHADLISRRMAFSPLPLAAVVIRMSKISLFSMLKGPTGIKIVIMLFLNLFLLKLITGLLLMVKSEPYLSSDASTNNAPTSPNTQVPPGSGTQKNKLADLVDPYTQLKRNRSVHQLKKEDPETKPATTQADCCK